MQQFTSWLHVVDVVSFVVQLLSHTPTVLQFLLLQSEQRLDDEIKHRETNRRILRCLLSWVSVHAFSWFFFCCNEGSCGMTVNEVKIGAITGLSY